MNSSVKSRWRRIILIGWTVALAIMICSARWAVVYMNSGWGLAVGCGSLVLCRNSSMYSSDFRFVDLSDASDNQWIWVPRLNQDAPGSTVLFVPLWLLYAPALGLSIWAWRRCGRFPRGHCSTCGYDLQGNLSGVCPECGTSIAKGIRESGSTHANDEKTPDVSGANS